MDNRIKVMLTDVNEDARSMLQDALEKTGRFTVVGSTGDGNEVLQMVADAKPDVLVPVSYTHLTLPTIRLV